MIYYSFNTDYKGCDLQPKADRFSMRLKEKPKKPVITMTDESSQDSQATLQASSQENTTKENDKEHEQMEKSQTPQKIGTLYI